MNTRQLQRLFDEYNARIFWGRKPRYRISCADRHRVTSGHRGECLPKLRVLFVSAQLPDEEQRRVLLHEMCHIGCPSHGRRFQARLEWLATEHGEAWAAQEAADYRDEGAQMSAAYVRGSITDLAVERPDLSWPTARRWLARDAFRRPRDFDRSYPWARTAWRRESREQQAALRGRPRVASGE